MKKLDCSINNGNCGHGNCTETEQLDSPPNITCITIPQETSRLVACFLGTPHHIPVCRSSPSLSKSVRERVLMRRRHSPSHANLDKPLHCGFFVFWGRRSGGKSGGRRALSAPLGRERPRRFKMSAPRPRGR